MILIVKISTVIIIKLFKITKKIYIKIIQKTNKKIYFKDQLIMMKLTNSKHNSIRKVKLKSKQSKKIIIKIRFNNNNNNNNN